ncbi:AraC family transcriptional regulator [Cystobacter fuscus]|uniref:helix-turn-helix domain-containing protein n=1 Tax=Cystobacter fuscus TaxID=43 RepID=UPI002B27E4AE|nr:AraC family transcriptional regulator [Cystobacter fuscus]
MLQSGQVLSRFGHAGVVPMHRHREAQLVVSLHGTAIVGTGDQDWTVTPRSMLWLASDTPHRVHTTADHYWLVLSFPPELVARATGWVEVSGFVHDLVERIGHAPDPERRARLTAVLVDELVEPVPVNARLRRVTELVMLHPSTSVAALARAVGMSERTFRRWFRADVGTSFTRWYQQRVVDRAIEQLDRGDSVKCVAADLGYTSTSAFIAMFKRVMNVSPRRYLRSR